jgi:murein DD-endopeptidase MepM/ murein hydrolase activator NlpD
MKIKLPIYVLKKEKLEYVKVSLTGKTIIKFLTGQIIFSVLIIILLSIFTNTPKEIKLQQELKTLKHEFFIINKKTDDVLYLLNILEKKDSIIYQSLFSVVDSTNKFKSNYSPIYNGEFSDTLKYIGTKLSKIEMKLEIANYHFRKLILEIGVNNERLNHTPAIQPISNHDLKRTSSGFGMRMHPIYKIRKFHYGMDFIARTGTPIYATADGTVTIASKSFYEYGKYIRINHDFDFQTVYAHMDELNVKQGDLVKRGDIIGTVGNTGLSTGSHLHYEVILRGKHVNPINYYFHDLTADQYKEMIRISNSVEKSLD